MSCVYLRNFLLNTVYVINKIYYIYLNIAATLHNKDVLYAYSRHTSENLLPKFFLLYMTSWSFIEKSEILMMLNVSLWYFATET